MIPNQYLILSGDTAEYKLKMSAIFRIIKVQKYFYIEIEKTKFLSIPKDKILDIKSELEQYILEYNIPYTVKLDWVSNFYSKKSDIDN